ncbi:hypothetical protein D3C76_1390920 [compost metagenome]
MSRSLGLREERELARELVIRIASLFSITNENLPASLSKCCFGKLAYQSVFVEVVWRLPAESAQMLQAACQGCYELTLPSS